MSEEQREHKLNISLDCFFLYVCGYLFVLWHFSVASGYCGFLVMVAVASTQRS